MKHKVYNKWSQGEKTKRQMTFRAALRIMLSFRFAVLKLVLTLF